MGSLAPIYFDAYTLEFCMMLAKGSTWMVVPEQLAMFPVKLVEFIASATDQLHLSGCRQ